MAAGLREVALNDDEIFLEHNFEQQVGEEVFFFKTLKMNNSLFIWIGNGPNFDQLTVSTPSKMTAIPPCTTILGDDVNNFHGPLTQRLVKRLKKQILLSLNVEISEDMLRLLEKRIFEEIKAYPENF